MHPEALQPPRSGETRPAASSGPRAPACLTFLWMGKGCCPWPAAANEVTCTEGVGVLTWISASPASLWARASAGGSLGPHPTGAVSGVPDSSVLRCGPLLSHGSWDTRPRVSALPITGTWRLRERSACSPAAPPHTMRTLHRGAYSLFLLDKTKAKQKQEGKKNTHTMKHELECRVDLRRQVLTDGFTAAFEARLEQSPSSLGPARRDPQTVHQPPAWHPGPFTCQGAPATRSPPLRELREATHVQTQLQQTSPHMSFLLSCFLPPPDPPNPLVQGCGERPVFGRRLWPPHEQSCPEKAKLAPGGALLPLIFLDAFSQLEQKHRTACGHQLKWLQDPP